MEQQAALSLDTLLDVSCKLCYERTPIGKAPCGEWPFLQMFPHLTTKKHTCMLTATHCPQSIEQTITYNGTTNLKAQVLTACNALNGSAAVRTGSAATLAMFLYAKA